MPLTTHTLSDRILINFETLQPDLSDYTNAASLCLKVLCLYQRDECASTVDIEKFAFVTHAVRWHFAELDISTEHLIVTMAGMVYGKEA